MTGSKKRYGSRGGIWSEGESFTWLKSDGEKLKSERPESGQPKGVAEVVSGIPREGYCSLDINTEGSKPSWSSFTERKASTAETEESNEFVSELDVLRSGRTRSPRSAKYGSMVAMVGAERASDEEVAGSELIGHQPTDSDWLSLVSSLLTAHRVSRAMQLCLCICTNPAILSETFQQVVGLALALRVGKKESPG
jgi:hypothetical protein